MAEPRSRIRGKGQVFSSFDLGELLFAYGDNPPSASSTNPKARTSLPSTIACLDEILTDFVIETCHAAAVSASYSRRQKIKVDDFKFVLRRDDALLGRVVEQLWRERNMREARKVVDFEKIGQEGLGELEGIAEMGGVAGKELAKGNVGKARGRGKKRKAADAVDGSTIGGDSKRHVS